MSRTFTHEIRIYQEAAWPHQWIGQCSCGSGTRCNGRADAREFFRNQGCINASEELLVGHVEAAEQEHEEILASLLLDAYAEWEGSSTDMLQAFAAHLSSRVKVLPDAVADYREHRARVEADEF